MCNVMGVEIVYDPDPTYELTADNVKKMLAIYMRFRFSLTACDIISHNIRCYSVYSSVLSFIACKDW